MSATEKTVSCNWTDHDVASQERMKGRTQCAQKVEEFWLPLGEPIKKQLLFKERKIKIFLYIIYLAIGPLLRPTMHKGMTSYLHV